MLVKYIDDMTKRSDDLFNFSGIFDDLFGSQWAEKVSNVWIDEKSVAHGLRGYRVSSNKEGMILEVDLPGVAPKDVSLWASGDQLIVKAQRGEQKFTNRYTIAEEYDIDTATSTMSDGQLRVKLQLRAIQGKEPRRIDIKAS